jgi:hypothetical protein
MSPREARGRFTAANLFDEARHVRLGIARIPAGRILADLLQRPSRLLRIIAAKSFAEEFAHGPAVALGKSFCFQRQIRRETDRVNTGRSGGGHDAILQRNGIHYNAKELSPDFSLCFGPALGVEGKCLAQLEDFFPNSL